MQKRALAVHDLSCVGRCSLTVALPILSTAGVNTALCKIVVFRTSVAKKYTARTTVTAKQPPSQRFSRRSVRKPNSSSTVPTAGRM